MLILWNNSLTLQYWNALTLQYRSALILEYCDLLTLEYWGPLTFLASINFSCALLAKFWVFSFYKVQEQLSVWRSFRPNSFQSELFSVWIIFRKNNVKGVLSKDTRTWKVKIRNWKRRCLIYHFASKNEVNGKKCNTAEGNINYAVSTCL